MKVFSHINELRLPGWKGLRTLILAFDKIALWAPSFSYLLNCCQKDDTIITPEEIIDHVKNHRIQIFAREWWLVNNDKRRTHNWIEGRPFTQYDKELLKLIDNQDMVFIANDYDAKSEAAEQVSKMSKEECNSFVKRILDSDEMPAYKQKIINMPFKQAAISLLRDARNHGYAFHLTSAERIYGLVSEKHLLDALQECSEPQIIDIKDVPSKKIDPNVDLLIEVLDKTLSKFQSCKNEVISGKILRHRTEAILADGNSINDFRESVKTIDILLASYEEEIVEEIIQNRILSSIQRDLSKPLKDYLLPKSTLDKICDLLCILTSAIPGSFPFLGLSGIILNKGVRTLQWAGILHEDYRGLRWPYYIAGYDPSISKQRRLFWNSLLNEFKL